MTSSREFPREPQSVPDARRFARQAIAGASDDVVSAVELMVSELATNCVRHAKTAFRVDVSRARSGVRVEISDDGAGQPEVRAAQPQDLTGRGLALVQMLSDDWGVQRAGKRGKTVWFRVAG